MSIIKGKALLAGAVSDLCLAFIFYSAWQAFRTLGFPERGVLDFVVGAVLLFFLGGAGKLTGFLGWNLGMLVHRLDQRRFSRLEAKIEREVTRLMAQNEFGDLIVQGVKTLSDADVASLRKALDEALKGRTQWIAAATPTTAIPVITEPGWHGVSLVLDHGREAWPCECEACGGTAHVADSHGAVVTCDLEFARYGERYGSTVTVFYPAARSVADADGVRISPRVITAEILRVVS